MYQKSLRGDTIISLHINCYLCDVTSLLISLRGWSNSLITGSLIGVLLPWKATILNHYNVATFSLSHFPNHWAVTPRPCLGNRFFNSLHFRLPGFCIKSACCDSSACCGFLRFCLSGRLLGLLLHDNILLMLSAICAFSQQVITNRRLHSHSVQ